MEELRYVYYFIIYGNAHLLLAAVIVPLVLFALLRAFQEDHAAAVDRPHRTKRVWFVCSAGGGASSTDHAVTIGSPFGAG